MAVTLRKLHPLFAAEIGGADLTRPLDDATWRAIQDAFEEYSILGGLRSAYPPYVLAANVTPP